MSNASTIPPQTITPSFSGHQTFPFRYTWLKKGIDAVTKDSNIFSSENASVALGVGKNMVSSIRHWCRASRLIEEGTGQPTQYTTLPDDQGIVYHRGQFAPTQIGRAILAKMGSIRTLTIRQRCG